MIPLLLFLILLALAWPYFLIFGLSLNANIGAITVIVCIAYVYLSWKQRRKSAEVTSATTAPPTEQAKAGDRVEPKL